MTTPLRPRAAPLLTAVLMSLACQAAAADMATTAAGRRASTPSPQRLEWRITELEGELAALQRFAQQQEATQDQLLSELDALAARHSLENLTWAALWALVSGFAAWQAVRRPRH